VELPNSNASCSAAYAIAPSYTVVSLNARPLDRFRHHSAFHLQNLITCHISSSNKMTSSSHRAALARLFVYSIHMLSLRLPAKSAASSNWFTKYQIQDKIRFPSPGVTMGKGSVGSFGKSSSNSPARRRVSSSRCLSSRLSKRSERPHTLERFSGWSVFCQSPGP
jgi:hypothetical protein